jgi:hypothetical protein
MPAPEGKAGADVEAAAGVRRGREDAAQHGDAFAHAGDPLALSVVGPIIGPVVGAGRAGARVGDGDVHGRVPVAYGHGGPGRGPGVFEHVGQGLLDDPVRGQGHPGRRVDGGAVDGQGHGQPGRAATK